MGGRKRKRGYGMWPRRWDCRYCGTPCVECEHMRTDWFVYDPEFAGLVVDGIFGLALGLCI